MAMLSTDDYDRMLELATAVIGEMAGGEAWSLVATELNRTLHGNAAVLAQVPPAPHTDRIVGWVSGTTDGPLQVPGSCAGGAEHPLVAAYARRADPGPLTVSDVADRHN